jgi:hypothetical protein
MTPLMATMVDPAFVCQCCKDKSKCFACAFKKAKVSNGNSDNAA